MLVSKMVTRVIQRIAKRYFIDLFHDEEYNRTIHEMVINAAEKIKSDMVSHLNGPGLEDKIEEMMLCTYVAWGDRGRLHLASSSVVNNALFNLSSGSIYVEDWVFSAIM